MLVPVPGTNVLPALALVVLNVALARRDGLLFLVGVAIGLAGDRGRGGGGRARGRAPPVGGRGLALVGFASAARSAL